MTTRTPKRTQRSYVPEFLGILSASLWLILYFAISVLPAVEHCQPERLDALTPMAVVCTAVSATAFVVEYSCSRRSLPLICGAIGCLLLCSTVIFPSDLLCEACAGMLAMRETVNTGYAEAPVITPSLSAWQLSHLPGPLGAILLIATNLANSSPASRNGVRGNRSSPAPHLD